jgi:hypothetical protein
MAGMAPAQKRAFTSEAMAVSDQILSTMVRRRNKRNLAGVRTATVVGLNGQEWEPACRM